MRGEAPKHIKQYGTSLLGSGPVGDRWPIHLCPTQAATLCGRVVTYPNNPVRMPSHADLELIDYCRQCINVANKLEDKA